MNTVIMRTFLLIAFVVALAGCGQTGPLYLPPTCSPVQANGEIVETLDEDGNVLPPCPPPETVATEPADGVTDPATTPESDAGNDISQETP